VKAYAAYDNEIRTHLALDKDAPHFRRRQLTGNVTAMPILVAFTINIFRVFKFRSTQTLSRQAASFESRFLRATT
jgi:hypothetical protein